MPAVTIDQAAGDDAHAPKTHPTQRVGERSKAPIPTELLGQGFEEDTEGADHAEDDQGHPQAGKDNDPPVERPRPTLSIRIGYCNCPSTGSEASMRPPAHPNSVLAIGRGMCFELFNHQGIESTNQHFRRDQPFFWMMNG
jgi:hypothetical protein